MNKMLRKCVLTLLLVSPPFSALASDGGLDTIGDLVDACQNTEILDRGYRPNESGQVMGYACVGYISGVMASTAYYNQVFKDTHLCLPKGVNTGQLISVFLKWAREHPEKWHLPAVVGVYAPLNEHYPCTKK